MARWALLLLIAALLPLSGCSQQSQAAESDTSFSKYVDADGNISRPEGYRDEWVHLGSWLVKKDQHARGPGVHDVYANPEAVAAFKENGQWPDGAVLVKEVRGIRSAAMTTGDAQWAGDIGVWFVMVRDRENRFPDNKIWGEGWGWALFKAKAPAKNVNSNWKKGDLDNCFGCHAPAKNTEWVYIEGYPTVRDSARYSADEGDG